MMISATSSRRVRFLHQFEDLRLDRHVERGRRLVGDDQLRVAGDRDRDHDPLAHPARQLVRVLLEPAHRIGDADQPQQLDGAPLRRRAVGAAMLLEGLGDLPADRQHRVQRGHRLLKDHADVAAAHLAHLLVGKLQQVAPAKQDLGRSVMRPGGSGISRNNDNAPAVLPDPLSPTIATVSPRSTV